MRPLTVRALAVVWLVLAAALSAHAQEKPPNPGIIGIQLSAAGDIRLIAGVLPGSPAAAAGIQPGDYILTVDGMNVAAFGREELIGAISGEPGTQVVLVAAAAGEATSGSTSS